MSNEDVPRLASQLTKAFDENHEETILDILNVLTHVKMTVELLRATMVGKTLTQVKKKYTNSSQIQSKAQHLLGMWKELAGVATSSAADSKPKPTFSNTVSKDSAEESVKAASKEIIRNREGHVQVLAKRMPLPERNSENELIFADYKEFKPNLTPQEIMEMGSFGGTYFRPIHSSVTGLNYKDEHKEFEDLGWYSKLNIKKMVTSSTYNNDVNKFNCSCGGSLEMWETSNWITSIDPYG